MVSPYIATWVLYCMFLKRLHCKNLIKLSQVSKGLAAQFKSLANPVLPLHVQQCPTYKREGTDIGLLTTILSTQTSVQNQNIYKWNFPSFPAIAHKISHCPMWLLLGVHFAYLEAKKDPKKSAYMCVYALGYSVKAYKASLNPIWSSFAKKMAQRSSKKNKATEEIFVSSPQPWQAIS
ncbi:hypothetical protein XELAEV_18029662mg [Xenopus laevis]|uniref:Uncharacterized protein n=1 Tax=Xenopus laevis TaxID=8355 RepID=A0A974HHZ0_XENLA|nr:hypothetical protein XELAEV_18029662mg [Xenopus laevis]